MDILFYIVLIVILFLLTVLIIRTIKFVPKKEKDVELKNHKLDDKKIIQDMVDMIRIKTISNREEGKTDWLEFKRFQDLLLERFPLVHKYFQLTQIGKTGLLYYMKGKQEKTRGTVLMAHYDVVPALEDAWERNPFSGDIVDDEIWGRGTLDTKGTLCGIMEAVEELLKTDYQPMDDLYLSFSGEEEIDGDSCREIVAYLKQNGITPSLVLDEGGAVVERVFPGVHKSSALIGIAEKGTLSLELSLKSKGGHASTPPAHTIVGELAKAAVLIEKRIFKSHLTKPVKEMFETLGPHSSFVYRMLFSNLWLFKPILDMICKKSGGELNAMLRTTCALTKMQGSDAFNVLPPAASIGMNLRLLDTETMETATKHIRNIIRNEKINIEVKSGMNPSIVSDIECDSFEVLKETIRETFEDVVVSPYLMMAASDSRHYCQITDKVYRFSPMELSKEQRAMIHGHNERIPVATLLKTVSFYVSLLKKV
jgi:carboxypeptidase PM20D1